MGDLGETVKQLVDQFRRNDGSGIAAELAFRFLFAVFPFGIFVTALAALAASGLGIENPAQRAVDALRDNLPPEVAAPLQSELERVVEQSRLSVLSLGALVALYSATGGTLALMKAMNRAFEVEESRGLIGRVALAVGLTLLLTIGAIAAFVTVVGGTLLAQDLAQRIGFTSATWAAVELIRWPLVFIMLVVAVAILFRLAPNVTAPPRWILIGAVCFAVGWLATTWVFALYVANVANYGATYGSLAGVIALMLWFYLTSIVLVASAQLVAVGTKLTEPERLEARRQELDVDKVARRAAEAARKRAGELVHPEPSSPQPSRQRLRAPAIRRRSASSGWAPRS